MTAPCIITLLTLGIIFCLCIIMLLRTQSVDVIFEYLWDISDIFYDDTTYVAHSYPYDLLPSVSRMVFSFWIPVEQFWKQAEMDYIVFLGSGARPIFYGHPRWYNADGTLPAGLDSKYPQER